MSFDYVMGGWAVGGRRWNFAPPRSKFAMQTHAYLGEYDHESTDEVPHHEHESSRDHDVVHGGSMVGHQFVANNLSGLSSAADKLPLPRGNRVTGNEMSAGAHANNVISELTALDYLDYWLVLSLTHHFQTAGRRLPRNGFEPGYSSVLLPGELLDFSTNKRAFVGALCGLRSVLQVGVLVIIVVVVA